MKLHTLRKGFKVYYEHSVMCISYNLVYADIGILRTALAYSDSKYIKTMLHDIFNDIVPFLIENRYIETNTHVLKAFIESNKEEYHNRIINTMRVLTSGKFQLYHRMYDSKGKLRLKDRIKRFIDKTFGTSLYSVSVKDIDNFSMISFRLGFMLDDPGNVSNLSSAQAAVVLTGFSSNDGEERSFNLHIDKIH